MTQKQSLVYRHLWIYRFVVGALFLGKYSERFEKALALLDSKKDRSVTELCFGDIHIAQWCQRHEVEYLGLDINPHFVTWAQKRGYNVALADLRQFPELPRSDAVVMMGSLYHFHDILDELVDWVMASSRRFIITEPVFSLARRNDMVGLIAKRSANAGRGEEEFRYDEQTLQDALDGVSRSRYEYDFSVIGKEAVIELRWKTEKEAAK